MARIFAIAVMVLSGALGVPGVDAAPPPNKPEASPSDQPVSRAPTRSAKDPNALTRLAESLLDPNAAARSRAALALGELDDVRACPPLVRLAATESDPNVLRSIATALAEIGAARGSAELKDNLVVKLMRAVPNKPYGQAEARDAVTLLAHVADTSVRINWRSFPSDDGPSSPVDMGPLAGRPVIGAWAALLTELDPMGQPVLLLTPRIEIVPLADAIAWHRKDRQLREIRAVRAKLAAATEKGRDTRKRLDARYDVPWEMQPLAKFIAALTDRTKLRFRVDWVDLKKHGYSDDTGYDLPDRSGMGLAYYLDGIEFQNDGKECGLSFLVEPDGVVAIATRETIAERLAARSADKQTGR